MVSARTQTTAACVDDGVANDVAVAACLEADVLDDFGFSGWIGPEPWPTASRTTTILV